MAWTCLPSPSASPGAPVPSRLEDTQPPGTTWQLPTAAPALKLTREDHAPHRGPPWPEEPAQYGTAVTHPHARDLLHRLLPAKVQEQPLPGGQGARLLGVEPPRVPQFPLSLPGSAPQRVCTPSPVSPWTRTQPGQPLAPSEASSLGVFLPFAQRSLIKTTTSQAVLAPVGLRGRWGAFWLQLGPRQGQGWQVPC